MNKKKALERLKTLVIILLVVSAVLMAVNIQLFRNIISRFQDAAPDDPGGQGELVLSSGANLPFRMAYMSEAGRCGLQYGSGEIEVYYNMIATTIGEAFGSASNIVTISETVWRRQLGENGVYFDYLGSIPSEALASWFGVEPPADFPSVSIRHLALVQSGEGTALCFIGESGEAGAVFYQGETAVKFSAVGQLLEGMLPNGASFAFELDGEYENISDYTMLTGGQPRLPVLSATSPLNSEEARQRLILAFDFNPNTTSRYEESDGTHVIVETSGTLRFPPGGGVIYRQTSTDGSIRIPVPSDGVAGVSQVVAFAKKIASDCGIISGAEQDIYLTGAQSADGVITAAFGYTFRGVPIRLASGKDAIYIEVSGGTVKTLELNLRVFTPGEELVSLMPEKMAIAATAKLPTGELYIAYTQDNSDVFSPVWLHSQSL